LTGGAGVVTVVSVLDAGVADVVFVVVTTWVLLKYQMPRPISAARMQNPIR